MSNPELIQLIRQQFSRGVLPEVVKRLLIGTGWSETDILEAMKEVEAFKILPQPAIVPQPSIISSQPAIEKVSAVEPTRTYNFTDKVSGSSSRGRKTAILLSLILLAILIIGGTAYGYFMKIGPFARPPYGENNLVSGVLESISRIDTSSYKLSGSLNVGKRDDGATPFSSEFTTDPIRLERYRHDAKRSQDISKILQVIHYPNPSGFPSDLGSFNAGGKNTYLGENFSLLDPVTGDAYSYMRTEGGKNFALSVTFETDIAISQIKKGYRYTATSTPIEGKKVTFTKDSNYYLYISTEPPKPLVAQLGQYAAYLPAEMKAQLSVSAVTDWRKADADWSFNVHAEGDFGDLTYKFDADALKKSSVYFFRINNMPSLFSSMVSLVKGQWVKVDTKAASSTLGNSYDYVSYVAAELPDAEKRYKERRKELTDIMKKAAAIADSEHLLMIAKGPISERIDGRLLYRYDLKVQKKNILPYYKRLKKEVDAMGLKNNISVIEDEAYLEYLQSPEFDSVFDYYDKNTTLTLWVDAQGYPEIVDYGIRLVPDDSAKQLGDKQINIHLKLEISNINGSVKIEEPKDAKPIEELRKEASKSGPATRSRDSRRVSDIRQIQLALELYFDSNGSYPAKLSDVSPKYMPSIPVDSLDNKSYYYTYRSTGGTRSGYHIGASLEDATSYSLSNDKDCDSTTGSGCPVKSGWSLVTSFYGQDDKGCGGETDRYCYDAAQ